MTISVIVVLVALFGGALSAARNSAKGGASGSGLARIDQILQAQYRSYAARSVRPDIIRGVVASSGTAQMTDAAARAWHIRRNMITADMPDRWTDVALMASGTVVAYTVSYSGSVPASVLGPVYRFTAQYYPPVTTPVATPGSTTFTVFFPLTSAQASYVATWNAFSSTQQSLTGTSASQNVNATYGGAECLFMIIMQGGFANCLDCNGLAQLKKGDKDQDGALEFWDDWDNPIDYILWAPGFQKSRGSENFFTELDPAFPAATSGTAPAPVRAGLGMVPLVYSPGPDGEYGLERNSEAPNLTRGTNPLGRDCGNPFVVTGSTALISGSAASGSEDKRTDNIVNVELKVGS